VHEAEDEIADAAAPVRRGDVPVIEYSSERGDVPVREYSSERDAAFAPIAAPPGEWGGLPAPWEPLPIADFAPPAVTAAAPAFADAPPVHFAEHDRAPVDTPAAAASPASHPHEPSPPPDLDALARSVYDVLKRRLAAERRREG